MCFQWAYPHNSSAVPNLDLTKLTFISENENANNTQACGDGTDSNLETNTDTIGQPYKNEIYNEQDDDEEEVENKSSRNIEEGDSETNIENQIQIDGANQTDSNKNTKSTKTACTENLAIEKSSNLNTNLTHETSKSAFMFNSSVSENNVNINNNNMTADKYTNIINSLMLGASVGFSNNLNLDLDEFNPDILDKSSIVPLHYSSGHPLFGHGMCKWPGCEVAFDDLQSFAK